MAKRAPLINVGDILSPTDLVRLKLALSEVVDTSTSLSLDDQWDRRTLKRRLLRAIGWPSLDR